MEKLKDEIIQNVNIYVKGLFENYSGHDYFHASRVFKTATFIAKEEHANLGVVKLASLLHDVNDRK